MSEPKGTKEDTKKTNKETSTSRNHLFEKMMDTGIINPDFFKCLTPQDQEEWKDFAAGTVEHYDSLIRMITDMTSTELGKEQLYEELVKEAKKK
jgi:hypothetical protein